MEFTVSGVNEWIFATGSGRRGMGMYGWLAWRNEHIRKGKYQGTREMAACFCQKRSANTTHKNTRTHGTVTLEHSSGRRKYLPLIA